MLDKIQNDLRQSQLSKNELEVSTLRLLLSEIKYHQINKADKLNDSEIVMIIQKEIKKRNESIESFKNGNRNDLADKEYQELQILQKYLPTQLPDEQLVLIVETEIKNIGASTVSDMGKVISAVKLKVGFSADPSRIAAIAKQKLT